MPLLTGQPLNATDHRRYTIHVPDNPPQPTVPAIVVFHGGGQDVTTIAARWGVTAGNPPPPELENYLLVFPESDPGLGQRWVHLGPGDPALPTLDVQFVRRLLDELTSTAYATGSPTVPAVTADPDLVYGAGFSNGAGMVWQLLNAPISASFRGFAAVGAPMDPEKPRFYRQQLGAGVDPTPAPVAYVHGTADHSFRPPFTQREVPLETTLPFFTVTEMLQRNQVPPGPASTTLVSGSGNLTEVVLQLFQGVEAFLQVTVVNGGHNWPMPTTVGNPPVAGHFDATRAIVTFWRDFAGLPG